MGKVIQKATGNSGSEDRFIELFCDAFGADKGQYVYLQYPMVDIYGRHRTIDFAVNLPDGKVAIEVDGNTWHQPGIVSTEKYHDDLLKQNSMVFEGWRVYRWTSAQIDKSPDRVKDPLTYRCAQLCLLLSTHSFLQFPCLCQGRFYSQHIVRLFDGRVSSQTGNCSRLNYTVLP